MVEGTIGGEGFVPIRGKGAEENADGSSDRLGGNRRRHALGKSRAERTWMQTVERDVPFPVAAAVRSNDRVSGKPHCKGFVVQRLAAKSGCDIRCEKQSRCGVPPMLHARSGCEFRKNGPNCHNIRLQRSRSNASLTGVEFPEFLWYHPLPASSPCFFSIRSSLSIPSLPRKGSYEKDPWSFHTVCPHPCRRPFRRCQVDGRGHVAARLDLQAPGR